MNRIAVILVSTILLTQIASYSFEEIPPQIEWEEPLQGDPDWQVSGRNSSNNSTAWEWLSAWTNQTNYSDSDNFLLHWAAGDLVNNITYNVTVDVYGFNTTSNNTEVVWSNDYAFNSSTIATNQTSGWFQISSYTLSTGCYYASFNLLDDYDGMLFDNDGFNFGINMNCPSSGGGNSSGNNSTMEWLSTYSSTDIHASNQTIDIGWSAGELVWDNNITYNVTVDIYGYNSTTNSTSIVWSDYYVFSPSMNETNGTFYISPYTLTTGCYLAYMDLFDANDGTVFDYDYVEFGVNMDCSSTGGGNGSGNNTTMEWLVAYSSAYIHASNQTIDIGWSAGELVWDNNITYNVTVDVYGYNSTTNSTSIVWSDYYEFSPSSDETNGTFYIPQYTLPNGCYFASMDLLDADDGMMFDYDGFEFGVNLDCSSTGGSNNTTME